MSHSKILTILENYKSLSNDIKKIERKTVFLKEKKSDLEDILKNYLLDNKNKKIKDVIIIKNVRREPLSQKYLARVLRDYYRNYYLSNKSRISNIDITEFTAKKSKSLLQFILKNRTSKEYHRLKIVTTN
tara:strand:+ start:11437 stop:11826 length:390 start_codon:yes stop_codon:yes gene_type:complete